MKEVEKIHSSLKEFLSCINEHNIGWRLEGSTNLLVQGMDLAPNDIDLAVDKKSFLALKDILSDYGFSEIYRQNINSSVLAGKILSCDFEILFYKDKKKRMLDKAEKINWQELWLNVLPLKHARKFYRLINQPDKVKLIEKHLRLK